MKAKKKAEQPKRKRFTKASFRKWKRENPEECRKVYGPWTSLEATVHMLKCVQPPIDFNEDGSDILGDIPFDPIDATEFVCAFAAECGYTFSQPLCDTISAYMKQGSKNTVKDLSEVIERAFNDNDFNKRSRDWDEGNGCKHFDCRDVFKEDKELCESVGSIVWGKQQCLMCKWWDHTHNGEPCDCTTGKCTYRWQDPNGEKQMTFWRENQENQKGEKMARKLVSIVEISKVSPIEGADKLEVAEMVGKGWKVVTAKGEVKPGDLCCYFEIDSALPPDDERYAFLKDRCLRKFVSKSGNVLREVIKIKTIKLRGQISQGLLMPIDKFPEILARVRDFKKKDVRADCISDEELVGKVYIGETADEYNNRMDEADKIYLAEHPGSIPPPRSEYTNENDFWKYVAVPLVGADVTALLHVEHYDEVKEQLQPETGSPISADAKGNFPTDYCPKTDEIRLQACTDYFETQKGKLFEVTEKRDGSSISFGYCPLIDAEEPFMVCSRNLRLKQVKADGTVPMMWKLVQDSGFEEKCKTVPNLMFQAEFCGCGVNKNRDKLNGYTIEVFRIYDVEKQEFVEAGERKVLCDRLEIPHVPIIDARMDVFNCFHTIDEILPFADGKTARGNPREGLVFKEVGTTHPCTFKVVSNKYLLSERD